MTKHNLLDKPYHIYYMGKTGVLLTNKTGKKGIQRCTKRKNVTVFECCSADGKYIPPTLIFKGVNKKTEFLDGLVWIVRSNRLGRCTVSKAVLK